MILKQDETQHFRNTYPTNAACSNIFGILKWRERPLAIEQQIILALINCIIRPRGGSRITPSFGLYKHVWQQRVCYYSRLDNKQIIEFLVRYTPNGKGFRKQAVHRRPTFPGVRSLREFPLPGMLRQMEKRGL